MRDRRRSHHSICNHSDWQRSSLKMGKERKKTEKKPPKKGKGTKVNEKMEKLLKRKTNQPITAQKEIMLKFMKDNPKFARGELDAAEMTILWKKLRKFSNKAGPKRSLRQWKKSWSDRKKGVKNEFEEAKKGKSVTVSQVDKDITELVSGSVPEELSESKRKREMEQPTNNKKMKISKPSSSAEQHELEQALHLSALQHAYETLVRNGILGKDNLSKNSSKPVSVGDLIKALQQSTCPPQTSTPASAEVINAKDPSKLSSNSTAEPLPGQSGIKNYKANTGNNEESSEGTSDNESESSTSDSCSSEDTDFDSSTDDNDDCESTEVNEKTLYSRVLEQQKNYYDQQLQSQNEFFTWFKERYGTQSVPELMQDLRRHLDGISVQLSILVLAEAAQDEAEEVAEPPVVGEEGVAGGEIDYDPALNGTSSLYKYLPE